MNIIQRSNHFFLLLSLFATRRKLTKWARVQQHTVTSIYLYRRLLCSWRSKISCDDVRRHANHLGGLFESAGVNLQLWGRPKLGTADGQHVRRTGSSDGDTAGGSGQSVDRRAPCGRTWKGQGDAAKAVVYQSTKGKSRSLTFLSLVSSLGLVCRIVMEERGGEGMGLAVVEGPPTSGFRNVTRSYRPWLSTQSHSLTTIIHDIASAWNHLCVNHTWIQYVSTKCMKCSAQSHIKRLTVLVIHLPPIKLHWAYSVPGSCQLETSEVLKISFTQ